MSQADNIKFKNGTASAAIKAGAGAVYGIVANSHSSGTVQLNDGIDANTSGVAATGTVTLTGVITPGTHASNVLTSTGAYVAATHAETVLTSDATNVTNADTVTINTTVYTFKTLITAAYDVEIGASAAVTLDNLKKAINATGTAGVEYFKGTLAHPEVVATDNGDTTQKIVARIPGLTANAYATTEASTHLSFADSTLGGGTGDSNPGVTDAAATVTIGTTEYMFVDVLSETNGAVAIVNQVLEGVSVAASLDNLKLAINHGSTEGTNYSTGTVVHETVIATTNTDTAQTVIARIPGVSTNATPTTETLANTTWADTTLGGGTGASVTAADVESVTIDTVTYSWVDALSETSGATAIPNQVLFGANSAAALDNLKLAINKGSTEGTEYSTGTVAHPSVNATTNSDTEQTVAADSVGTAGNLLATTSDITNGAWGAALLSGGAEISVLMFNTYSFASGSQELRFPEGVSFNTGLYLTIGGTLDYTILYD